MNYYTDVLRKYAVFSGRAPRKEYWMFFLFNVVFTVTLSILGSLTGITFLALIYTLAILVPSLAVITRRLHDTGRSVWWLLLALVPFIGAFILVIFAILDSQSGQNQYGQNPKGDSYVAKKTNVWLIVILSIVAVAIAMAGVSVWGLASIARNNHTTSETSSVNHI